MAQHFWVTLESTAGENDAFRFEAKGAIVHVDSFEPADSTVVVERNRLSGRLIMDGDGIRN